MEALERVCAPARLYRPGDGDSMRLLVNFRRRGTWDGAQVVDVRLKGYRARESTGALKNEPEVDPVSGVLLRVSGVEATRIATDVLTRSELTLVEFTGANDRGRDVCDVYVRMPGAELEHLGRVLMALHAVLPGSTIGVAE